MNKRNKRILIGLILLVLLALGAAAGLYYHDQTKKRTVRGSSSVEFVTTDKPGEKRRPHRVVEEMPWPMYGYDVERSHVAADFRHRPPFRRVWSRETGDYIEFPPVVAENRVYVANQHGDFLAIRSKDGKVVWRKDFGSCIAGRACGGARHRRPGRDEPDAVCQGESHVPARLRGRDEREQRAPALALQDRRDRVVAAHRRQDACSSGRGTTRSTRST